MSKNEADPFRPKKRLGQHFLRDPNVIRKIVGAVRPSPEQRLVEIGPGEGAITGPLLELHPGLIAYEIDARAVGRLREKLPALDLRHKDVLAVNWKDLCVELDAPLYVVSNLPYNVTTPVLFGLLEAGDCVEEMVLMMQLEVARRLAAQPRTKEYGILAVSIALQAEVEILFRVSRHVFKPKPAVESAVVRLVRKRPAMCADDEMDDVRRLIRTAFNQRRKTLRNSLRELIPDGVVLPDRWSASRPEELQPFEFVELACFLMP